MRNTTQHQRRRGLRHETLETRQLLALAAFNFNLYRDNNGSPGSLISQDQVHVGDRFFVEIAAEEFDSHAAGIAGISLDLNWDPAVLQVVEEDFAPNKIITDRMPLLRDGFLRNPRGGIDNLSALSLASLGSGENIGNGHSEPFAMIPFIAIAPANDTLLRMQTGGSQIVLESSEALWPEHIRFERQAVHVLPAEQAVVTSDPTAPASTIIPPTAKEVMSVVGLVGADSATTNAASMSIQTIAETDSPKIAVTVSGDHQDQLTFATRDAKGNVISPLVRPTNPDSSQSITILNEGTYILHVERIEVIVAHVTVENPQGFSIAPGQSRTLQVAYVPDGNRPATWRPELFSLARGLVVHSDAANNPELAIGLSGQSTFDADINFDGRVDLADISRFNNYFGKRTGMADYSQAYDPNGDGIVDLGDMGVLNAQYGKRIEYSVDQAPENEKLPVVPTTSLQAAPAAVASVASQQSEDEFDALLEELAQSQLVRSDESSQDR